MTRPFLTAEQYRQLFDWIDAMADTSKPFESVENRDMAERLLANLPPEQREAVLLRYGEGLKYREIAAVTGQPLRTVQSRVRKAMKTIKEGKP